jgi:hypothetical protein
MSEECPKNIRTKAEQKQNKGSTKAEQCQNKFRTASEQGPNKVRTRSKQDQNKVRTRLKQVQNKIRSDQFMSCMHASLKFWFLFFSTSFSSHQKNC